MLDVASRVSRESHAAMPDAESVHPWYPSGLELFLNSVGGRRCTKLEQQGWSPKALYERAEKSKPEDP